MRLHKEPWPAGRKVVALAAVAGAAVVVGDGVDGAVPSDGCAGSRVVVCLRVGLITGGLCD